MSRAFVYDDVAEDFLEVDDEPWEPEADPPCPGCGNPIDCEADCPELAARCAEYAAYMEASAAAEGAEAIEVAGPTCRGCGCSSDRACPGGCVWATKDLCSRCAA